MVLIVESGSTKADWIISNDGVIYDSFETEGLNPFSNKASYAIIKSTTKELSQKAKIEQVHFYGAGVIGNDIIEKIRHSFQALPDAVVHVHDDLLGAARATCNATSGVVCILGTGSNIGYYDGQAIIEKVASGGYLLGGEGSGMALGKEVLIRFLRNQLSNESENLIMNEYEIDHSNVTQKLYNQSVPNRYMASFAPIVHRLQPSEKETITNKVFTTFLNERILKLKASQDHPIHFVGSIALSFQKELEHMMKINNLALGNVVDKPIHNLVEYHKRTN